MKKRTMRPEMQKSVATTAEEGTVRDLDESDLKAATGGATLDTTLSSTSISSASLTYWSGGGGLWSWSGGGGQW